MGRRAIVLLVALILAGLAGWAVWNYLTTIEDEIREDQAIVTVFRAGQRINEGSDGIILFSDFTNNGALIIKGEDQAGDVPPDAITTEEQLNQVLTGRVAAGPISEKSILTEAQWVVVTVDITPLAELIPSGKQALTIGTDSITGVNGFVEPGDRVNMIITLDLEFDLLPPGLSGVVVAPEGEEPPPTEEEAAAETATVTLTRFVMQGIPVMATGRAVRPDEDGPPAVDAGDQPAEGEEVVEEVDTGNETVFTFEVTPEQAETIVFAMQAGAIWLTLVPEDFVEVETRGVTIDTLFGGDILEDIFGSDG